MDNAFAFANKNAICTKSSYSYTGAKATGVTSFQGCDYQRCRGSYGRLGPA